MEPRKRDGGKRGAEPDGATKTWLRLPFGSRHGLRHQLHTRSRCHFHRLGGLRLEPEPEPPKQGFNWLPGAVVIPRAVLTKRSSASARGDFYARRDRVVVRGGERDDLYRR
jgi:hypothetical protein